MILLQHVCMYGVICKHQHAVKHSGLSRRYSCATSHSCVLCCAEWQTIVLASPYAISPQCVSTSRTEGGPLRRRLHSYPTRLLGALMFVVSAAGTAVTFGADCLSDCLFVCLYVCLSICLSVCVSLSVCL